MTDRPLPTAALATHERVRLHAITTTRPAPGFFSGHLMGNGGLGAVVTTRPDAIVVRLGHNAVWDIRVSEEHAASLGTFEDAMNGMEHGKNPGWLRGYRDRVEGDYNKPYPRPFACGSVILGFDRRKVELLGHELSLFDGVCTVSLLVDGAPAKVELFVDQGQDRLWVRSFGPAPLITRLRLLPDPDGLNYGAGAMSIAEAAVSVPTAGDIHTSGVQTAAAQNAMAFRQILPGTSPEGSTTGPDRAFQVALGSSDALLPGDIADWHGKARPSGPLERYVAGTELVLCAALRHGTAAELANLPLNGERPDLLDYESALRQSRLVWAAFWARSGVALDDPELEKHWYRNTYFANCTLRAGKTCPGIFGNWSYREIGTAWHGDYHMNYNTQQLFWGTFSSNHVDLHEPYVDLVSRLTPGAEKWAEGYYKLPGAAYPHSAYPVDVNMPPCPNPPWSWQMCETPWTVQSLWWHYLYTQDTDYLRDRAFQPIRAASLFMTAYISRPDARGSRWNDDHWHIYPTVVPELYGITQDFQFNADCLTDLTLTRFLLNAYIKACEILGLQTQEAALLQAARAVLAHLPGYAIAPSGAGDVFVAVPGANPDVVYNVPVAGMTVFPGEEHGLHSPPEVLARARRSVAGQQLEGGNELVFANLQAARLGILDLERFKRQLAYCEMENGTCTDMVLQGKGRYDDHTLYDFMAPMGVWVENFALPAVINECLLHSHDGIIRLFPNWPEGRAAAFSTLRAVGAFLVSARKGADGVEWVEILAERGGALTFDNPWPEGGLAQSAQQSTAFKGAQISLATRPMERLTLRASPGA